MTVIRARDGLGRDGRAQDERLSGMLVMGFKPGHDGGIAVLRDGQLICSLESEKDSNPRYNPLSPMTVLEVAAEVGELPDVVALGGWANLSPTLVPVGAGYLGATETMIRKSRFFGRGVTWFSSSHARSHIYGAVGMSPPETRTGLRAVLVWEGTLGSFYLVDADSRVVRTVPVLNWPGSRYSELFMISNPASYGDHYDYGSPGKLMALAAYGDPDPEPGVRAAVDQLMTLDPPLTTTHQVVSKQAFRDSVIYNCGVTSQTCKDAAKLLTERIFTAFADVAKRDLPPEIPLLIGGGCGLNCDWNHMWSNFGHFSSVFVPPCPNDSGSALGTAIDAQREVTGDPYISWDVYAGLEFVNDCTPDPSRWVRRPLDFDAVAVAVEAGQVLAWVQGRWEIGPRALGNRSLIAEPTKSETRDRLNQIKEREPYRPVAPIARVEDLRDAFLEDFVDPYMLYFRRVRDTRLQAITHVDGSARVQTVSRESNEQLHRLLSAFHRRTGIGVLCNTSLNWPRLGFINKMSDLVRYCEARGVDSMGVGDVWYTRRPAGEQ